MTILPIAWQKIPRLVLIKKRSTKMETKDFDFRKDDAFEYFVSRCDEWDHELIYRQGIKMINHHFHLGIEKESPIDNIIAAVAYSANTGAYATIAAMLGIDDFVGLKVVASDWEESKNSPPPPITFDELLKMIAAHRAEIESIRRKHGIS
jgi:hypothetical protein